MSCCITDLGYRYLVCWQLVSVWWKIMAECTEIGDRWNCWSISIRTLWLFCYFICRTTDRTWKISHLLKWQLCSQTRLLYWNINNSPLWENSILKRNISVETQFHAALLCNRECYVILSNFQLNAFIMTQPAYESISVISYSSRLSTEINHFMQYCLNIECHRGMLNWQWLFYYNPRYMYFIFSF